MAETGQLAAWVGREKGCQEDGHITRGAIAPN
jgi:hypothetical protein